MRNRLVVFVGLVSVNLLFSPVSSVAAEQKLYVLPEMIQVHADGIFVCFDDVHMKSVRRISSDGQGLYVEGRNLFNLWYCSPCRKWNHHDDSYCNTCGREKPNN